MSDNGIMFNIFIRKCSYEYNKTILIYTKYIILHSLKRMTVVHPDGRMTAVEVNRSESPLAWLHARTNADGTPMISDEQFAAGEMLRRQFDAARQEPSVTSLWGFSINSGQRGRSGAPSGLQVSDKVLEAKRRLFAALDAVGPQLSPVLLEVCCMANGLEAAERRLSLPKRAGKVVLSIALTQLARHYGILSEFDHANPAVRTRLWARQGYRPELTV